MAHGQPYIDYNPGYYIHVQASCNVIGHACCTGLDPVTLFFTKQSSIVSSLNNSRPTVNTVLRTGK